MQLQTQAEQTSPLPQTVRTAILQTPRFKPLHPWVDRLSVVEKDHSKIVFGVTDASLAELFTDDLSSLLSEAMTDEGTSAPSVSVVKAPATLPESEPRQGGMTFDAFFSGASNRLAVAAAQAVAEAPGATYNPLLVYASVGLGKTHLLHAIRNRIEERHPGLTVLFLTADSFRAHFHQAAQENTIDRFRSWFERVDVLILDDLHRLSDHPVAANELLSVFNILHNSGKQIVLGSSVSPQYLSELPASLVSRLQWGLVVDIDTPTAVMRKHFILRRSRDYGLALGTEVVDYLSEHTFGPVRELEGLLNTLRSRATLLDEPITLSLARKLVGSAAQQPARPVTLDDIDAFICDRFSVSTEDLFSKSRARSIAYPRQIAMFLAHTHTSSSLEEIGRHFGGRDHSTVKHGCEKIRKLSETDPQLRALIGDFRRAGTAR